MNESEFESVASYALRVVTKGGATIPADLEGSEEMLGVVVSEIVAIHRSVRVSRNVDSYLLESVEEKEDAGTFKPSADPVRGA